MRHQGLMDELDAQRILNSHDNSDESNHMAYRLIDAKTNECLGSYSWIAAAVSAARKRPQGWADQYEVRNELDEVVAYNAGADWYNTINTVPEHSFLPLRLLQRSIRRKLARGTDEALR